jgi:hypothetical protein
MASQTWPLSGRVGCAQLAQVRRHRRQRLEQVGQFALAAERHHQLGRERIEHQDGAVGAQLHQSDRRHVQELQQLRIPPPRDKRRRS